MSTGRTEGKTLQHLPKPFGAEHQSLQSLPEADKDFPLDLLGKPLHHSNRCFPGPSREGNPVLPNQANFRRRQVYLIGCEAAQ